MPGISKPTVPRTFNVASVPCTSTRRHATTGDVSVRPQPLSTGTLAASKKVSRRGASEPPPLTMAVLTASSCRHVEKCSTMHLDGQVCLPCTCASSGQQHWALQQCCCLTECSVPTCQRQAARRRCRPTSLATGTNAANALRSSGIHDWAMASVHAEAHPLKRLVMHATIRSGRSMTIGSCTHDNITCAASTRTGRGRSSMALTLFVCNACKMVIRQAYADSKHCRNPAFGRIQSMTRTDDSIHRSTRRVAMPCAFFSASWLLSAMRCARHSCRLSLQDSGCDSHNEPPKLGTLQQCTLGA